VIEVPQLVIDTVTSHPYPLIFATISGAHLYGFPSPDSDYDLRGVHILPAPEVLGLIQGEETIQRMLDGPPEVDLVTHDAAKFFRLLLKRNGYVLEQVLSPLVLKSGPDHEELCALALRCVTRHHAHHYFGFAARQWDFFVKERRLKPLLYVFRALLTGIHLMRAGIVDANLVQLNELYPLPYIPELIARKIEGAEKQTTSDIDVAFFEREYQRLVSVLEEEEARSQLPLQTDALPALNDLLLRLRLR
jgi:predicted nucleotidyltransferase